MLGIGSHTAGWQWHAVGKHPAAADYIHLLEGPPLATALGNWMRKGYEQWQSGRSASHETCCWRFWMRGGQKERLVCGVVRDSSDRIGRPFPLMVMGAGALKHWERQWPQLPRLLVHTWCEMERLAAQRFEDLTGLSERLQRLTTPGEPAGHGGDGDAVQAGAGGNWDSFQKDLVQTGRAMIAVDAPAGADAEQHAHRLHAGLLRCCRDIPRAVFMGGSPTRVSLAVMLQPLTADDFVTLWDVA